MTPTVSVRSGRRTLLDAAVPEILSTTFRQLLGRRRTVLLGLLCAVPVVINGLARAAGGGQTAAYVKLYDTLVVTLLLPIVALLIGTAAFGAEIEDGTIVYLLGKPVPSWRIVFAKLLGATAFTVVFMALAVVLSGLVAFAGEPLAGPVIVAFVVAISLGALCYSALFIALSLFTRRALMIGLVYFVVWEGGLSNILPGIANLSIRQYALGAAHAIYDFKTELAPESAFIFGGLLIVVATALAIWRLSRFELSGGTD